VMLAARTRRASQVECGVIARAPSQDWCRKSSTSSVAPAPLAPNGLQHFRRAGSKSPAQSSPRRGPWSSAACGRASISRRAERAGVASLLGASFRCALSLVDDDGRYERNGHDLRASASSDVDRDQGASLPMGLRSPDVVTTTKKSRGGVSVG
jgi:hypothetical protein